MEKNGVRTIGKYEIISKVAEGGMGALYKARHPTLDRTVLLKKLTLRGGSQFIERFKREARIMMDIKNDRIVQVYDHFKEGHSYYIVEEYVDGISLDALIRRERYLSNDAATLVLYEVCRALKYAHDKQVIHRDIKPGNILLSRQGEVKLADFGIATSLEDTDDGLTKEGMVLGTPSYIPPEQIDDAKSVDRRADIYSLGVVLYEMLTGRTPFPGSFTAETIHLIHKGKYTPPHKLNPGSTRLLRRVARTCMRVKRRRRYQDLKEIIRLLERRIRKRDPVSLQSAVKNVVQGKPIGDIFRGGRAWLAWALAVPVLACLLAAGGWYAYRQGLWFETFEPGRYGLLVISAVIDTSYKEPGEIFFQPVVYREDDNELTRIAGIDFGLHLDSTHATTESFTLVSNKLYLPAGRYRVKASLEGELAWSSFILAPRVQQKRVLATVDGLQVTVRQGSGQRILTASSTVTDAATGADLTGAAVLSVFLHNRWVPWSAAAPEDLTSGGTWRFRVERDGYYPQVYSLVVKPYQTALHLDVRLVPQPGMLAVRSRASGVTLLLNGSEYYLAGGKEGRYDRLPPLDIGTRQILLGPGDYHLTVRRSPGQEKSVSFHVSPMGTVSVNVDFDPGQGGLTVAMNK
jgi:tRNA A-37 threonylcarbamoyl transferase component Bud32